VTKEFLNGAQVRATLEHVRCRTVAKPVRTHVRGSLNPSHRIVNHLPNRARVNSGTSGAQE